MTKTEFNVNIKFHDEDNIGKSHNCLSFPNITAIDLDSSRKASISLEDSAKILFHSFMKIKEEQEEALKQEQLTNSYFN